MNKSFGNDFDFIAPRILHPKDPIAEFDCEIEQLNRYLQVYALQAQQSEGARTYVSLHTSGCIAGYFTLAYGSIEFEKSPERVRKGLAKHPIPVMLLARLAVDKQFKGQGLGKELLRDALLRILNAADIAGLRAVVVDTKNAQAKAFYQYYGFEAFRDETNKLFLIIKDIRARLR